MILNFFVNGFSDIQSFSEDFDDPTLVKTICAFVTPVQASPELDLRMNLMIQFHTTDRHSPRLSRSSEYFGIYVLHYYYALC